jgi:hypothetical protein
MTLTMQAIKAAQLLAKGRRDSQVISDLGISESSLYSWKRKADFSAILQLFMVEELAKTAALTEAAGGGADVIAARRDEEFIRDQLKPVLETYIALVAAVIERVKNDESDSIPSRQIPQLLQGMASLIETFRTSHDRLAGLESIICELGKIEKSRAERVVSIATSGRNSAAPPAP